MNTILFRILSVCLLFSSCASLGKYPGVGRIRTYAFEHADVPAAFEGYRIAFISDLHYQSKFRQKHLRNLVRALQTLQPDLLLLGGDYLEGCDDAAELFRELSRVQTPDGIAGVLGNHDYARCTDRIRLEMKQQGIRLLEHCTDTVWRDGAFVLVSGVRNPFDLEANGTSPTAPLQEDDFVVLLVHTPDYAQDADIVHTDLALAGHTHGGQVSFLRLWVPATGSKYGRRFLSGLAHTDAGVPVIVTNGLGTSRLDIRCCAPSEIVEIVLHRCPRQ